MKVGVDYIGVTICFFCHDGKGNLLLQKRSKNCRDEQGRWDNGGGKLEFGETWEDGVRREIMEEYCTGIKKLTYVGASNVLRSHDDQETHWIALVFAVEIDPLKVAIGEPEKIDEIGWFKISKLPTPLHSMLLRHLEMAKEYF